MTTETIVATLATSPSVKIVDWMSENGYIAYPKDLVVKGRLPDDLPIEVFLKNGVKVAVLYFEKEGCCTLKGWLDTKHSQELARGLSSVFSIKVALL